MSQLMFWNKQNNNSNNNNNNNNNTNTTNNSNGNTNDTKNGKRNWLHAPDALVNGHVVYLVKFFGNLPVEQAKGIEVVKDAIRKLQFAQQMKKAETGTQEKFKKVEITISVDGVAVQEPRTQKILHQFPLHNISYCADEKGVKKFFSFIAKTVKPSPDGNANGVGGNSISSNGSAGNGEESHECFVFISNKLASDITLTIGQAFDLAYRKYISSTEKTDLGKAQQQISDHEKTIAIYKDRLRELSLKLPKSELDAMLFKLGIKDILDVPQTGNGALTNGNSIKSGLEDKLLIDTNSSHSSSSLKSSSTTSFVPLVPPRNNLPSQIIHKSSSQKMEELLLNSDSDSDFDPRADENTTDGGSSGRNDGSSDLFGFEPSKSFGQQLFYNNNNNNSNNNINNMNNNEYKLNNNNNNNNNNNSMNNNNNMNNSFTPPLLAPPPKVAAPRRSTSVNSNLGNNIITNNNNNNNTNNTNNIITNGNPTTDLFGSDPFDTNGPSIFKHKLSTISVDDFSLESLDPLRK